MIRQAVQDEGPVKLDSKSSENVTGSFYEAFEGDFLDLDF
jgi:hypothetical protein